MHIPKCFYLNIGFIFDASLTEMVTIDQRNALKLIDIIKKSIKLYTQEFNQKIYKKEIDVDVEFITICYRSKDLADLCCFADHIKKRLIHLTEVKFCNMFISDTPITGDNLLIAERL